MNGHDGSTSVQVGIIPIRFFCTNMLPILGRKLIKFRHTENVEEMLQWFYLKIKQQLAGISKDIEVFKYLASKKATNVDAYIRQTFDFSDIDDILTTHAKHRLGRVLELFATQSVAIAGTWYAAFQAVAYYLNYDAGRRQETRLNSLWFGRNGDLLTRALVLAREFADD
jgi:hypothetical protein